MPQLTPEERKKREEEERRRREAEEGKTRSIRDVKKVLWGDKKTKKKLMDEIDNY